jgi:hypothetical protein
MLYLTCLTNDVRKLKCQPCVEVAHLVFNSLSFSRESRDPVPGDAQIGMEFVEKMADVNISYRNIGTNIVHNMAKCNYWINVSWFHGCDIFIYTR